MPGTPPEAAIAVRVGVPARGSDPLPVLKLSMAAL